MKWSIVAAICIGFFGVMPLMGLPGAIVISAGDMIVRLFGIELVCMKGDHAWPTAILTTWIWPVFIPICFYVSFRKIKDAPRPARWFTFGVLLYFSMILFTMIMESVARSH